MKEKERILKVITGFIIFIFALVLDVHEYISLVLFITAYIIIGGKVVYKAFRNILNGQVFDENFLMVIATIGAFLVGEYPEAVAVMLFFQIGEIFEHYAVGKSRKSISDLMNIRPDYANVLRDGKVEIVEPDEIEIDEIIVVKPGERIPVDATVTEGNSMVDTSALTGESVPRSVHIGDMLLSGCINLNGVIEARVTKEYYDSTVNKILDLVENASNRKSQSENFITKFARYYTPAVVLAALCLAFIPPLFVGNLSEWFYRALTFLVISCPCALVISVPLSFFGGIGAASEEGILIKGSNYLEALAKTDIVVFDKTGTLTKGVFEVSEIHSNKISDDELLEYCAYVESGSNHPIALSIVKAYGKEIDLSKVENVEEIAGHGIKATVNSKVIHAGNQKMMNSIGIDINENYFGTLVYVAIDNEYAGCIVISDKMKEDSKHAITNLKQLGISRTVMLTGDHKAVGEHVAGVLGLDEVYCELLPQHKVEKVEKLLSETKGKLVFTGDGINDAPVLARADIGIAMGGLGSDAAMEAADIVLMSDEPSKIATAMKLSKKTLTIVYQNIIFALGVKFLVLILGAFGYANMWLAVFADVGVSVLAILNAMRVLFTKIK